MRLYDPAEHEQLTSSPWDDERARAGIDGIVAETLGAYEPGLLWPLSPLDDYGFAFYLDACLRGRWSGMPILDIL